MGKGFWEHMVADSTSWVQDSNERLKEYLEGSLSKAGLESFVTVMPRRDGYRIYAGEKPDAPFAYVDVYLDGNALVVEGSSKRHLSEQEMGDLARFLGISGSEAGEKLNRFRKFIDALQKHAGEDVDKLEDLKVSDACGKAAKGQKIGEDAPKATVSDDLGASAEVYLVHDGDMSFGDAADIISSFNTDYSLEDGLLWASEKWVDPLDSATEVNLALAAGILGIANGNDIVASDLYDSLSDDNVYEKLAVKDLVVQVYTSDHREYHEFIYKDPSHELLRKVVRTVLFFSESRDNYKDTYEGLKKILPAAQISDSVSVNFKNSKGGSVVRQISGERVGKPVGKARPVRDSKASEVAKIDKALGLVRNAYKSTGKKSEVKGMSLDIKGLDDAVVDLKAYKSGKEDKIAVEIRWKDGERKGFDYGIDAKASHVYGDIVSLKKVADSLEDPTEDLIGIAKEGDITYAEVESIFSANGVAPSLDDRIFWVNYKWDDPEASGGTVRIDLSSGLAGIGVLDEYESLFVMQEDRFLQEVKVDYALVQTTLYPDSKDAEIEYKEFYYENPSKFTLSRISRLFKAVSIMALSYEGTVQLLEAGLPKEGRVSDSVHVDIKNRKGGASVRQVEGSCIGKPVAKACPVRDSKLAGQKVGKAAPKAKVSDFAAVPESALVPFQNAWAKLQSNSKLPKAKTSIDYMGDLIPVELERKGADAVDVRVNGKSVGSYDLKKDSADYVFNAIIGRDDTTVGDRVDNGLSKTSDAAGNSGIEMLKLLSHLLLNDIDYTLQDDGSVDVDIPIGSGSDGSIAITLSGNAPDLNSALKGTVTNANISVSVNGSGVRSWVVSSLDASKLKDVLLDLHALSGSSSATVDEAIAILDVAYEDFAKSAVADAVEGTFAPQTKVRIKSLLTTDPYGHSGDAGVVLGRLDVDPDTVVVLFESGVPVALYDIDAIALDGTPAKTQDAAPAPFAKVKEGLELFVPLAITAHGGSVGADSVTITEGAAGRISVGLAADLGDTEVSAAAAALDNVARVLGYAASKEADGRTFLLTPLRVSDSVEDAASLVASLESDSSIENQRRVADIMLKNDMHVLKDGRKEIMVIANADTDIPLFSFKQHAWMNIHDKALDSGDAFGVYNLKERRWFLAPEDARAARWGFEDAAKRYASKEDAEAALNEVAELQPGTAKSAFVVKPLGRVSDSEKRSDFVFPADSSDVNDGKGHFPLNSLRRARAAIAYANKYQELPTWYSGDLDLKGFVDKIVSEVKKQYPSIEISPESYIPAPDQK